MAYTEEKFFTRGTKFGKTWRISILEDGGAGAGDRITAKDEFFTKRYPTSEPREFWKRRILEPILEVTIRFDPDTDLSFYKGIAQAPDDTYRIRFQYDGSTDVIGSIKGGIVTINERAAPKTVTLRAKPLTVQKANDFPLAVSKGGTPYLSVIGDIINQTGFDLPIYTYNDWEAAELANSTDYLWEAAIDDYHFRDYAGNRSEDTPFTYYEALESVIPDSFILFMADGAWHLMNVPYIAKQEGANVQRYRYTWDGNGYAQSSDTTVSLRETFTNGNYLLRHASDSDYHEGIKSLVQEYNHKTLIQSMSFDASYTHTTAEETSTESTSFTDENIQKVIISGDVTMQIQESGGTAEGTAEYYIKVGDWYWDDSTSAWVDSPGVIPLVEVDVFGPADDGLTNTTYQLETDAIPDLASGDIEVQFQWGTAQREDGTTLTVDQIEWTGWGLDIVTTNAIANGASIEYKLTQSQSYSLELSLPDRIFGQGPTEYSEGRIRDNVDGTALANWGPSGQDYSRFVMSQIMSTQRNGIRVVNAELWSEFNIGDVVEYEGEYFLILGGDFNGKDQKWQCYLYKLDYNTASDTLSEVFIGGGQSTTGTSGGSGAGLSQENGDARYLRQTENLAELTSVEDAQDNLGLTNQTADLDLNSLAIGGEGLFDLFYEQGEIDSFFGLYLSEADLQSGNEDLHFNSLDISGKPAWTKEQGPQNLATSLRQVHSDGSFNQWIYPVAAEYYEDERKYLLSTSVQSDGTQIVTLYNERNGRSETKTLYSSYPADDHNAPAIYVTEAGSIVIALTGHNDDSTLRYGFFDTWDDIGTLTDTISFSGNLTYAQIQELGDAVFIFTREGNTKWRCNFTEDEGSTWNGNVTLFSASDQYYGLFRRYNTPDYGNTSGSFTGELDHDKIKFTIYDHPINSDLDELRTGNIVYDWDGNGNYGLRLSGSNIINLETSGSDTGASASDITLIYTPPSGRKMRFWDMYTTENPLVYLISTFPDASPYEDADYRLIKYEGGSATEFVLDGVSKEDLAHPTYFGGGAFPYMHDKSESDINAIHCVYVVNDSEDGAYRLMDSVFDMEEGVEQSSVLYESMDKLVRPMQVVTKKPYFVLNEFSTYDGFENYDGSLNVIFSQKALNRKNTGDYVPESGGRFLGEVFFDKQITLEETGVAALNTLEITTGANSAALRGYSRNQFPGQTFEIHSYGDSHTWFDGGGFVVGDDSLTSGFFTDFSGDVAFRDTLSAEDYELTTDFSGVGWQGTDAGDFNIRNLVVRESARFRELIIDQLSIIAGSDLQSVARGKIKDVDAGSNQVTLENPRNIAATSFIVDDFFWIKEVDIDGGIFLDLKGQVSAIDVDDTGDETIITLTLDTTVTGGTHDGGTTDISALNGGEVMVQRGHPTDSTRQSLIYTTVSDSDAPVEKWFTGIDSLPAFDSQANIQIAQGNTTGIGDANIDFGLFGRNFDIQAGPDYWRTSDLKGSMGDGVLTWDGNATQATIAGWIVTSNKIAKGNLQLISDNSGFTGLFDGTPSGVATVSAVNTPTDFNDRIYAHLGETYSAGWTGRFGFSLGQSKVEDAVFEVAADMSTGALTAKIASIEFDRTGLWVSDGGAADTFAGLQQYQTDSDPIFFAGADDKRGTDYEFAVFNDGKIFHDSIGSILLKNTNFASFGRNPADASFPNREWSAYIQESNETTTTELTEVANTTFIKRFGADTLLFTGIARSETTTKFGVNHVSEIQIDVRSSTVFETINIPPGTNNTEYTTSIDISGLTDGTRYNVEVFIYAEVEITSGNADGSNYDTETFLIEDFILRTKTL